MYVRSMVVKGRTYYQIVEGVRDGAKVRQRVVLALGRSPDPRRALKQWERRLKSLQKQRALWTPGVSKTTDRRIERLDAQIGELKTKVFKLGALINSKLIGITAKTRGMTMRMERITAECGENALTIAVGPRYLLAQQSSGGLAQPRGECTREHQ